MKDEEEEAVRLQREAAAALRPEDYGQSEGSSEEEEEGSSEEESGELQQRSGRGGCGRPEGDSSRERRAVARRSMRQLEAARMGCWGLFLGALLHPFQSSEPPPIGHCTPATTCHRQGEPALDLRFSYLH